MFTLACSLWAQGASSKCHKIPLVYNNKSRGEPAESVWMAWVLIHTLLSLTGQLHGHGQETMGTLDLGGASTQITFLPQFPVSHFIKAILATHLESIMVLRKQHPVLRHQLSSD